MTLIQLCKVHPIGVSYSTPLRAICTSSFLRHNPGLKKKGKALLDQKKLQKQKEKQESRQRKQVITPPVDPDSIPDPSWFNSVRQRSCRPLTIDEVERNELLQKEWTRYLMRKHIDDLRVLRDKVKSRNDALRELKKESDLLYQEALKVDKSIFPLILSGPMDTPPLDGYEPPDFVD